MEAYLCVGVKKALTYTDVKKKTHHLKIKVNIS